MSIVAGNIKTLHEGPKIVTHVSFCKNKLVMNHDPYLGTWQIQQGTVMHVHFYV